MVISLRSEPVNLHSDVAYVEEVGSASSKDQASDIESALAVITAALEDVRQAALRPRGTEDEFTRLQEALTGTIAEHLAKVVPDFRDLAEAHRQGVEAAYAGYPSLLRGPVVWWKNLSDQVRHIAPAQHETITAITDAMPAIVAQVMEMRRQTVEMYGTARFNEFERQQQVLDAKASATAQETIGQVIWGREDQQARLAHELAVDGLNVQHGHAMALNQQRYDAEWLERQDDAAAEMRRMLIWMQSLQNPGQQAENLMVAMRETLEQFAKASEGLSLSQRDMESWAPIVRVQMETMLSQFQRETEQFRKAALQPQERSSRRTSTDDGGRQKEGR